MFTKSTVSQSMIDAVNSILDEEKKQQQLDEASTFDWKSNKNETDPKFTTKKSGERTGHESKKTEKGVQYTKKLSKGPAEDSPIKEEGEVSFKERLLEKNWIAGAIKKPGAETAAAKKAGMGVQAYAHKHAHDSGKAGKRARLAITLSKLKKEEKTFDELLEDLNDAQVDKLIYEVLSKDADAGDYIHDFVHSKNSKFAGKSKEERKKMALGAYYGKKNEEVEIEEATWAKEELIGGQKKLDKNHNGKLDSQDFKILRGQKQKNEGVMDTVKKVGGKVLKTLGHGSDEDMRKDLQRKVGVPQTGQKPKTEEVESPEVSTDTLAGRVKGGKPNQHSSIKVKLKAEEVNTPMSQAKNLARLAMKKVKTEMLGKPGTSE